jgi:hypothetical protein
MTQKIDTTENWNNTTNFIPLKGELIVYLDGDGEVPRQKIGDGVTDVKSLPFLDSIIAPAVNDALAEAKASGEFDGTTPMRGTDYWTDTDVAEIRNYINEAVYGVIDGEIEAITNDKATYIRDYGFYNHNTLVSANFANVTKIGNYSFYMCRNLKTINTPALTNIEAFAFRECSALDTLYFENVITIKNNAFDGCTSLSNIEIPLVQTIETATFRQCEALGTLNLPAAKTIKSRAFWGSGISSLVLPASEVCTLENTDAFAFTPIESGTGRIYVPAALVDSYKTGSWSAFANQIRAIEV